MAKNNVNVAKIVESWSPMISKITKGAVNEGSEKMAWMCQYAHNHSMALNEEAVGGVSFPFQTLNNTNGIGNAVPAQFAGATGADQTNVKSFGSGDKWNNFLPMALQVAARTVGFDLVNTTPFSGPTGVLPFMDYVYSGSKAPYGATPGYDVDTANPQFNAAYPENKGKNTAYKSFDLPHAFRCKIDASTAELKDQAIENLAKADEITIDGVNVQYIGLSRLTADPMFRVLSNPSQKSLGEIFANGSVTAEGVTLKSPRLISALEDQIQGFTGSGKNDNDPWSGTFMDGTKIYDAMDRATGEQQYARQMSLQLFTKFVSVKTRSVAVAVTQEQVQDLQKQWGIDVIKMVENAAINELSQSINKEILSRLFALGWKNHIQANRSEGINLNLNLTPEKGQKTLPYAYLEDGKVVNESMNIPDFETYGGSSNFENQDTILKRISARALAAGNVIMNRGRRGAANFVVTNYKLATAMQLGAQYSFSPIANTFNQTNGSLYPIGTMAGLTVYTDPFMKYDDTRVLVGRKGDKDEPGLNFCPYIMAESVRMISEGTASPKILIKSRYALIETGFYPETQYLTYYVKTNGGLI